MSGTTVRNIRALAEATLVEAAWAQWSVVTTAALPAADRRPWTIVDPEALILGSLAAGPHERRLTDLVAGWTTAAVSLLSMQRLRTLAKHFPERVQHELGRYAPAAKPGGPRKSDLPVEASGRDYRPRHKAVSLSRLTEAPALTLRLRAGIGVSAKADLLSMLLGLGGEPADLGAITAATAYNERTIRIAVREMTLAGFIHEIEGRPSSYYVDLDAWAQVLGYRRPDHARPELRPPRWCYWWAAFAFLAGVAEWGQEAEASKWTDYVASSRARDLVEHHQRRLRQAQVESWDAGLGTGEEYLGEFEHLVTRVQLWTDRSLYGD
jgi:hypothetical protein